MPKIVERAKPELVYYSIHLTCMFGGKKYKKMKARVLGHVKGNECIPSDQWLIILLTVVPLSVPVQLESS